MKYEDVSEALTGFPLSRVIVLDTETTGITANDEVLSIGICDAWGTPLFYSLVRPTAHFSWPKAQKVNRISPKMVQEAPTLQQIAPEIRKHILGNKLIVGYNVHFDIRLLTGAGVLKQYPSSLFDVMREYATIHGSTPARYKREGYVWSKLEDCAQYYGYQFAPHGALEDAQATAFCYRSLLIDDIYMPNKIDNLLEKLQYVSISQTKDTAATVTKLVEEGLISSTKAELRLGQITRGKNAGAPRYECYIDNQRVGAQNYGGIKAVRILYSLSDSDPLPLTLPCKALLSVSGARVRCEVKIIGKGKLKSDLTKAAQEERERLVRQRSLPIPRLRQPKAVKLQDCNLLQQTQTSENNENAKNAMGRIFFFSCALIFLLIGFAFFSGESEDKIISIFLWIFSLLLLLKGLSMPKD